MLSALADLQEKDNAELARAILEEALLGRVHTLTLAAQRYKRLGFSGISGELGGIRGNSE